MANLELHDVLVLFWCGFGAVLQVPAGRATTRVRLTRGRGGALAPPRETPMPAGRATDVPGSIVLSLQAEGVLAFPGFVMPSWNPTLVHITDTGCVCCEFKGAQDMVVFHRRPDLG